MNKLLITTIISTIVFIILTFTPLFNYVDQLESGLKIRGDVVKILTLDENRTNFIIAKNSEKLSFISLSN